MNSHRGQVFTSDLVVAVFLFCLAVGLVSASWDLSKVRLQEGDTIRRLEVKAYVIADVLSKTPGVPSNWQRNISNASSLGLAVCDRVLNEEKVDALTRLQEEELGRLLGVADGKVAVVLRSMHGEVLAHVGDPPLTEYAATSSRVVTYVGEPAILEVTVWDEGPVGVLL